MMRCLVLMVIYAVCAISPGLIDFISLSGSLFNSTLGFILPVLIYQSYFASKGSLSDAKKWFNIAVLIFGGTLSAVAVWDSTSKLLGLKQTAS